MSHDTAINAIKAYYTSTSGIYTKISATTGDPSALSSYENTGIIQDKITWTYIPSGNDIDTNYQLGINTSNKTITL